MRIAIIGGGAAAISLLHQLIGKLSGISNNAEFGFEPIEICIIEKQGEIGPGLAYSTSDHSHILNLPAKVMSLIPEDPRHFFNWAVENKELWQKDFPSVNIETCDFPPRALYGVYLKWLLNFLVKKAAEQKISVKLLVKHEAIDIRREIHSEQFRIVFSSKDIPPLMCGKIVLSVGHLESENFCGFKENPFYVHSPWPVENLKKIPHDSDIFIAGTRLTAIDTVFALKANGHKGKIVLGSRLGLLPCVIGKVDSTFNRRYLTLENIFALSDYGTKKLELEQVLALLQQEFNDNPFSTREKPLPQFDLEKTINPGVSPHEFLRDEIKEVKLGDPRHWQNVLFSLYANISVIWDSLSERAKETFLFKYYSVWMTYLAAFPLENAEKILSLLENKEIEVKGGFKEISYDTERNTFRVRLESEVLECKYFINATGASHDVVQSPSPLLQNMVKRGLLVPYHLGGVKVDFKSLQPIGECTNGLFVMGDSGTYGACMATADLGQSGKQATRVANTIGEQLRLASHKPVKISEMSSSNSAPASIFGKLSRSLSENSFHQNLSDTSRKDFGSKL